MYIYIYIHAYINIYIYIHNYCYYIFDRRSKLKSRLWSRPLIAVLEKDVLKNPEKCCCRRWEFKVHF